MFSLFILFLLISCFKAASDLEMGSRCTSVDTCRSGLTCEFHTCFSNYWSGTFSAGFSSWNLERDSYGKENRAFGYFNGDIVCRVRYPKGSTTPKQNNVGGTGFYAVPLELSGSTRIWLEYDVFFPKSFDFVLGGKLPGIFGGHSGCSVFLIF